MADAPLRGSSRSEARAAIVDVAARLLAEHGPAALTTRGVAHAAGAQPPTIYRLFGDKDGLLDAVAEHVQATYVTAKSELFESDLDGDPVAGLRLGWQMYVDFGLSNPTLFALLHDPGRRARPAAIAGLEVLRGRVHRVARAGRLRVGEEQAVELIHAAGVGTVLTLLAMPAEVRDTRLADEMWDAVSRALLTEVSARRHDSDIEVAVTFRTVVSTLPGLSDAERALMTEWIDRAIGDSRPDASSNDPRPRRTHHVEERRYDEVAAPENRHA